MTFGTVLDDTLSSWRAAATGARELPEPSGALTGRLAELAALEAAFDERTRHSTGYIHCDLRLDNVVISGTGQAWICDWNHLCTGPAWLDLTSLLLTAEASALDVDTLFFTHPTAAGLPEQALDECLAAFAGYYLEAGAKPPIPGSPVIRGHQLYYGALAVRWLARRRGW